MTHKNNILLREEGVRVNLKVGNKLKKVHKFLTGHYSV